MYSDISNLMNSIPIVKASCLLNSVLPTPVGPENKNEPIGLPSTLSPALESLMVEERLSTASSCPNITLFKFSSSFSSDTLSEEETVFTGILAMEATIFSISISEIVFFLLLFGRRLC